MEPAELAEIIRGGRYRFADEYDLQDGIEAALLVAGVEFEREVRVKGGRLDFLVDRVGVEVKITCPVAQVTRQVRRYLEGGDVDGLVVVAMTPKHGALPPEIAGKPVEVIVLAGAAL